MTVIQKTAVVIGSDKAFVVRRISLSFLTQMPLTHIKIDQSFTRGLPNDDKAAVIVRSLIVMSHNNYEVSATPSTESETKTKRAPPRGVAETLLHETAGRELRLWRFDRDACRCRLELPCLWGM